MKTPNTDRTWQTACHELAIRNLVARLAQAGDDRDERAYRQCLAPTVVTATDQSGEIGLSADEITRGSMARLACTDWTHHKLANAVIQVGAGQRQAAALIDVVVEVAYSAADSSRHRATVGGRYDLGFVYFDDDWLIDRRITHWRYRDGDIDDLPRL